MELEMLFRFFCRLLTGLITGFSLIGCAVVTKENSASFTTPELCVYAYNYQTLSGWVYDRTEWIDITNELRSRGYTSAQDCSAFGYATKECERSGLDQRSDLFKTCISSSSQEFTNATAGVFQRYSAGQAAGAASITKPTYTQCNRIGNQVFCNSF